MNLTTAPPRTAPAPPGSAPDPYVLSPDAAEAPPTSLGSALRRVGPGMVLAASIVGSGELIATTTLGAQVGFAALWMILLSCAIKPIVQAELGRYTIVTGRTGLEGFNEVPGPRAGVSWVVWAWGITVMLTLLQIGGMYGGVAQVLHLLIPAISVGVWVGICLILTLVLLLGGGYERIERFAIVKVGLFTVLTICAAAVLFRRSGAVTMSDLLTGLSFQLPADGLVTAVAVFGMTGVGATELVMYPYWCIEKGYARFVGPRNASRGWLEGARGWIRVMHLDIACSLVIYTLATVAFYLLGAAVLHDLGMVPASRDTITVLSRIYTETLGEWSLWVFYAGAVVTLYGTIFASTAAHSRLLADLARLLGIYRREDAVRRRQWRQAAVVVLSVIPVGFYWLFESPVQMVVAGGVAQALMLPIIGVAALYLRRVHVPADIHGTRAGGLMLWLSTSIMGAVALYYLWSRIA